MKAPALAIFIFAIIVLITGIILKMNGFPGWFLPVGLGILGLLLGGGMMAVMAQKDTSKDKKS